MNTENIKYLTKLRPYSTTVNVIGTLQVHGSCECDGTLDEAKLMAGAKILIEAEIRFRLYGEFDRPFRFIEACARKYSPPETWQKLQEDIAKIEAIIYGKK